MSRDEGQDDGAAAKGLEAVDAFMDTFNTRDAKAWAASLSYPHVRPTAKSGIVFAKTPEEFAAAADFSKLVQPNWDHTEWVSKAVIHARQEKVHVAGSYKRIDTEGKEIWTNQVLYAATESDGQWGVQARFPAGLTGISDAVREHNEASARQVLDDFMATWNGRDKMAWAATLNYPHVRVASGKVAIFETPEEYAAGFDFEAFSASTGWHHSEWGAVEVLQCGENAVNLAVKFNRFDAKGVIYSSYDAIYFATLQDGHWGVRARSSYAP